ncbi:hypothetical protein [Aureimonas jatrophae]|uniref:Muramidase (Phage lambda lysozyme) n=1 Tax=Aureimonas jatrophae TaxID=1166073 RepID=A0A1H0H004_9HYPH|nr:hypothetical protein [Aureimonas jatrophae]MBB3949896.1 muramidase (phage lysozyme) [Aureimonas jatrophae]SDO12374.1 hypothetical protein SAMN05192530_103443 [Aureimonas jatrophae]
MDRTVPAGAARLLDFIRATEVGTDDRSGYDVIYGHNQGKLPKPVTLMTVDEVIASQASWTRRFKSSATGGYQFMRNTLKDLKAELGLRGAQVLDPDLQDRLGFHLLKRRGYEPFVAGTITRDEFGKRLAQEWASFPVLRATKGAHRTLSRGQSYYAGDQLNKALVQPAKVEAVLAEVLALSRASVAVAADPVPPAPVALPKPEPVDEAEPTPTFFPAPTTMPLPAPDPIAAISKAIGAAKGGAAGALASVGGMTGVSGALSAANWLPSLSTTQLLVIFGGVTAVVAVILCAGFAFWRAYKAPANASA